MANTRSALKRWRQSLKRRARNRSVLGATRTALKKARDAVRVATPMAAQDVTLAISRLDSAAHKGAIHPNAAARKKSRLMKRLNAALPAIASAATAVPPPAAEAVVAEKPKRARAKPAEAAVPKPAKAAKPAKAPKAAAPAAAEAAEPATAETAEATPEKPKRTRAKKSDAKTDE